MVYKQEGPPDRAKVTEPRFDGAAYREGVSAWSVRKHQTRVLGRSAAQAPEWRGARETDLNRLPTLNPETRPEIRDRP